MLAGRKALATVLVLLFAFGAQGVSAASPDDKIKNRKSAMKEIGGQMKVIKGYLEGKGTAADVAAGATKINGLSKTTPALFVPGTARGEAGLAVETEALAKIWEDPAGFQKAWDVLIAESQKLAEVAATDDPEQIGAQFGAMAKMGCGGCHKVYRVKK